MFYPLLFVKNKHKLTTTAPMFGCSVAPGNKVGTAAKEKKMLHLFSETVVKKYYHKLSN